MVHLRTTLLAATFLVGFATTAFAKTVVVAPGSPGETPLADAVAELVDGDKLVIKKGTYDELLGLSGLSDVRVVGKGRPVVGAADPRAPVGAVITDCTNVSVSGIAISAGTSQGLRISNSEDIRISRCEIDSGENDGIGVGSGQRVVIDRCTVTANGGSPTRGIDLRDGARFVVSRCRIIGPMDMGVDVRGSSDCVVRKGRFEGMLGPAIVVSGPRAVVERNRLVDCSADGIAVGNTPTDAAGSLVQRNRLKRAGGVFCDSDDVEITRNTVVDSQFGGITAGGNGARSIVSRNKVVRCAEIGIELRADEAAVSRNAVIEPGEIGVSVNATAAVLDRNKVKRAAADGFEVRQGGNTLRRNRSTDAARFDLFSTRQERENVYESNKFGTVSTRED